MVKKPTYEDLENRVRELEAVLAEKKERTDPFGKYPYRVIMDQAADAIFINDPTGKIVDANPAACRSLGYELAELLSKSIEDIDPNAIRNGKDVFWEEVRNGKRFTFESRHRRKDGSEFPVEISLGKVELPEGPVIYGIARDITERKKVELQLRENEERFRSLFENAPLAYQSLDENGNLVEVNETWCSLLGYKKEEVLGRNMIDFLPSDFKRVFQENFPKFKKLGFILGIEFEMIRKDGSEVIVSINGKIGRHADGTFKQTHCILTDVTEQQHIETELEKSRTRYQALFEMSPVPLWEEDFTEMMAHLADLKKNGVKDLRVFFDANPDALLICSQKIKILDVNQAALALHHAKNKDELIGNLDRIFTEKSMQGFKKEVLALAEGKREFGAEGEVKTLNGELRYIVIKLRVNTDSQDRFLALVSTTDITEREALRAQLDQARKMEAVGRLAVTSQ